MAKVGGIGAKLLKKMGWQTGKGLGVREDGRVEPVRAHKREGQLGIGGNKNAAILDTWWERLMEDAYGAPKHQDEKEQNLLEACGGYRCRPHGTAKLARLEAHDRAHRNVDHLDNFDGPRGDRGAGVVRLDRRADHEEERVETEAGDKDEESIPQPLVSQSTDPPTLTKIAIDKRDAKIKKKRKKKLSQETKKKKKKKKKSKKTKSNDDSSS